MKPVVLLLCTLLIQLASSITHAATPAHLWSQRFGGTGSDTGYAVAVDGSGNVYVSGSFQATVNFGGANLVSSGGIDIFLAKYDADGLHEWSKSFGSTLSDHAYSIAVDAAGNVYMTGDFGGTVNFGGAGLISAGGADAFIAKYNTSGVHLWSARYGAATEDSGSDVAVTPAGDVFVIGQFTGTVSFGGAGLISAGSSDIFLAKYNTAGAHQWSYRFGSGSADYGQSLDLDAAANVIAMGSFAGTVNFGGVNLIAAGQLDVCLFKYSNAGAHQWSQRFGGTSNDFAESVVVDGNGNAIITGLFLGSANFGGSTFLSAGNYDIFFAKYNSAGAHQWSRKFGSTDNDYSYSLDVDASGAIYLIGNYHLTVDFGGGGLVSYGGDDIFLAKYDAGGNHLWSQHYGSPGEELGVSVAVGDQALFITGYFNGNGEFGGTSKLVSAGTSDVVLAKYSTVNAQPFIQTVEDVFADQGGKVKIFFDRSGGDDPSASNPVTHYVALRRDDPPPAPVSGAVDTAPNEPSLLPGWIAVGSVDAFAEDEYGIVVPTVGDSTISNGQYWSVFMIRAATDVPSAFYTSPPDSGYSLDNLAPGAPTNLVLVGSQLSWSGSPAPDFDYFTVYGANSSNFGAAFVIGYTAGTTKSVLGSSYPYYFVTATDFAGNESDPASTGTATAVGDGPTRYVLSVSNYPNPFNPSTSVRYTVPSRGHVTVAVYDARGALVTTLFEGERPPGAYTIEWNGLANGTAVSSGVYFARIEHNGTTRSKKMVLLK
jgi:hypothetical protein